MLLYVLDVVIQYEELMCVLLQMLLTDYQELDIRTQKKKKKKTRKETEPWKSVMTLQDKTIY